MALISRKRQKVEAILGELGDGASPEAFSELFRERHPGDWERVVARWEQEERDAPAGKGRPMQPPDVYVREMYRNGLCRVRRQPRRRDGERQSHS